MTPTAAGPSSVEATAWLARSREYLQSHEFGAAESCLHRALALQPDLSEGYELLGKLLYRDGRKEEAGATYGRWLQEVPGHPVAAHLLAATGGAPTPERASDAFIASLYRRAAAQFDSTAEALGYRAPELLHQCALAQFGTQRHFGDVLDLGCGTGLCGVLLRGNAVRLTGVDLSEEMLSRAGRRGCYDRLVQAELTQFLHSCCALFDLVIAADVFCYFGNLGPALQAVRSALHDRGSFVFSVEAFEDPATQGYQLQEHGRYAHSLTYVQHALECAGFEIASSRREMLRFERGAPVEGWIMAARIRE